MDIISMSKQELINKLMSIMITPQVIKKESSEEDDRLYSDFINKAKIGKKAEVSLPLEYALKNQLFNLIKQKKVFISNSIKFITTFTTVKPSSIENENYFNAKYVGHEFEYGFLDNHPGIINIDKLKNIPVDYEGLMAVPPTVLEYKNINHFNIHRIIYLPIVNGKCIYSRVVISNKVNG